MSTQPTPLRRHRDAARHFADRNCLVGHGPESNLARAFARWEARGIAEGIKQGVRLCSERTVVSMVGGTGNHPVTVSTAAANCVVTLAEPKKGRKPRRKP